MLLSGYTCFDFFLCPRQKFCRNNDLVTFCKIPQGPSHILFTGTTLISNGSVIEIHSQIQASFYILHKQFLLSSINFLYIAKAAFPGASGNSVWITSSHGVHSAASTSSESWKSQFPRLRPFWHSAYFRTADKIDISSTTPFPAAAKQAVILSRVLTFSVPLNF